MVFQAVFDTHAGTLTDWGACARPRSGETWGETVALKPSYDMNVRDKIIVWPSNMFAERFFLVKMFHIRANDNDSGWIRMK